MEQQVKEDRQDQLVPKVSEGNLERLAKSGQLDLKDPEDQTDRLGLLENEDSLVIRVTSALWALLDQLDHQVHLVKVAQEVKLDKGENKVEQVPLVHKDKKDKLVKMG